MPKKSFNGLNKNLGNKLPYVFLWISEIDLNSKKNISLYFSKRSMFKQKLENKLVCTYYTTSFQRV